MKPLKISRAIKMEESVNTALGLGHHSQDYSSPRLFPNRLVHFLSCWKFGLIMGLYFPVSHLIQAG